jgi:phosphoribosylaminoimidazolecarboxamide formyltransferase / IMP cyclohydrolase
MRAILSVSDKAGLVDFAKGLAARGVELVSTGGTAKALAAAGLPVKNVSDVTGFPEMMDGRVKTLHPKIHGGILARRHRADDLAAIKSQGIDPVDLVVVNLYPFEKTAQNPATPFDELVEQIDIGGPSLLRAAGKNFRDVLVVVYPSDYARVLQELDRPGGPSLEFKYELMKKAFAHTAQFDTVITRTLEGITCSNGEFARSTQEARRSQSQQENRRSGVTLFSPDVASSTESVSLRYGENPHQQATWVRLAEDKGGWKVHQGKGLSYTNLLDLDAALRIVLEFPEPAAAVIKHTNPCGTATGATIAEAYVRAREADPLSAFGGIVGLNRPLDAETAKAITSTFIEAVIAPSIQPDAVEILARKTNMRVVTTPFDALLRSARQDVRTFLGGVLSQDSDRVAEAEERWPQGEFPKVVTKRQPTADEWTALRFAWRVCAHVKSNTILFSAADHTLAVGAGQMSRVDAVKVAAMKAAGQNVSLKGSVVASDAFFPFRDGPDAIAAAGATAIVQPGGSIKDAEVIAAADEHGLAMVFTGRRHFRH